MTTPPSSSSTTGEDSNKNHHSISEDREVACGIANLGNTCYANAVLQALAHAPEWCNAMELTPHRVTCTTKNNNQKEEDFCVLCQVEHVLCEIHSPSNQNNAFAPVQFMDGFTSVVAPWFKKGLQEDSHEFLRLLTDGMQKSVLTTTTTTNNNKNNSYAFQLFRGQVESTVTCFACHETSTTIDPMEDLGLECVALSLSSDTSSKHSSEQQSSHTTTSLGTIQHSLDKFIQEEALDCYKCEKCSSLGRATKRSKILKVPPILTLHLKRFRYGYAPGATTITTNSATMSTSGTSTFPVTSSSLVHTTTNNNNTTSSNNPTATSNTTTLFTTGRTGSNKIEGHIKFDELFDLKPYLTENWGYYWEDTDAANDNKGATTTTTKKEGPCFCRLFAVVVHTGANSHSGHYYALVRNLKKNEWWKMDDGNAIRISTNDVVNAHAYMLFYRVVEHPISIQLRDDVVRRRQTQQLLSKVVSNSTILPNGHSSTTISSSSNSTVPVNPTTTATKEETVEESQEVRKEIIVPLEQQTQQQQEEGSNIQSKLQATNTTDTLPVVDVASTTTGTDTVVPQEGADAVATNTTSISNTNNNNNNNKITTVNEKKRPSIEDWEVKWRKKFKATITSSIVPTLKQVQMWISEKIEFKAEYFEKLMEDSKGIERVGDTTDVSVVSDDNVKEEGMYCAKILKGAIRYLLYKQTRGTVVDSILLPAQEDPTDSNHSSIPDKDSSSISNPTTMDQTDCTMTVGVATEA